MRRDLGQHLEGNEGKVMEEGKGREVERRKREGLRKGEGKGYNLEEVMIEEAMDEKCKISRTNECECCRFWGLRFYASGLGEKGRMEAQSATTSD